MHKPAQLSLGFFALIFVIVLATLTLPPAFAQQPLVAPAPPVATARPTTSPRITAKPTPTPLTLTSEAAGEMKLTASPIKIGDDGSLLLKQGEKKQVTLKVFNNSPTAVKILTLTEDFIIGEDGETPVPVEESETDNRWSLKKWVTTVPATQSIPAGEVGIVNVLIEVPKDALPGGRYGMVLHQPDLGPNQPTEEAKDTAVNQRVGTLLYVQVDGPIMEDAFIRNFTMPQFQEFGPVPYSFVIDSDSDIHIKPQLTFNVYNIWGKKIFSEPVESRNIFPKASRSFTDNAWERIWGLGRYKGEVVAVFGSQSVTKTASVVFWLFPLKLALAIAAGLIALVGIATAVRRHYLHRKNDQSAKVRELEAKVAQMEQEKKAAPGDQADQ